MRWARPASAFCRSGRLGFGSSIAAVGRAFETGLAAHRVERHQHIAAIAAAGRFHEIAEALRPLLQRLTDRQIARGPERRRLWNAVFRFSFPADRERQVEAGLVAGRAALQRGIERNRAKTGRYHEVAVGLEA